MNKVVNISGKASGNRHPADMIARLERLEDVFLMALQELRAAKSELAQTTGSPTLEKLLDVKAVVEILGDTEVHIYQLARAGKLPAIRVGKYWKFVPSALQSWIEEQSKK